MLFTIGTQQSKEIYQGLSYLVPGTIRFILGLPSEQRKYQQTETVTYKIREINTTVSSDNENAMCFLLPSFPTLTKSSICFPQSSKE